jgi:N-methylhydantoinase B
MAEHGRRLGEERSHALAAVLGVKGHVVVEDSGGAGRYRGGAGLRRTYRFLAEEGTLQVRSDRRAFRPYGLAGGQPGRPSRNLLNPQAENRLLPAKFTRPIRCGDVFSHELPGGGGWGDPLEREPWRVVRDVRNGFVSLAAARAEYGVVVDPQTWSVDLDATARHRAQVRATRAGSRNCPTA